MTAITAVQASAPTAGIVSRRGNRVTSQAPSSAMGPSAGT